jgi:hypothetical protein
MITVDRVRGFAIVKLSPEVTRCVLCATDWTPGEKERHADFCPAAPFTRLDSTEKKI